MTEGDAETHEDIPGQGCLGTVMLLAGILVVLLSAWDRAVGLPFSMPRSWYSGRNLWVFLGLASAAGGYALLRSRKSFPENERWAPESPGRRFTSVVLYTRHDCHLCDQAKDTLNRYAEHLPEVSLRDIDQDKDLVERFGNEVPVVEIDNQVRFRGQINEVLLRRLIDSTPPTSN